MRPIRARETLAALAVLALAVIAPVGVAGPARAAGTTTLYASPHGTGLACTHAHPCAIDEALSAAPSASIVILAPGSYGTAHTPLNTQLALVANNVTIRDQAGATKPVLYSRATLGLGLTPGSSIDGLVLNFSGTKAAFSVPAGATASHVAVQTSTAGTACVVEGAMRDSLCADSLTGGNAIVITAQSGTATTTLDGVTAEARSASGTGISVEASSETPGEGAVIHVHATNVIAHGGLTDIHAEASIDATATDTITLAHSDYATATATSDLGTATIVGGATNVSVPPRFVNAAKGNYREVASSPTVNAGAAEPKSATDLDGQPRTLGTAADIGAYELGQAPTVGKITKPKARGKTAHLTLSINPQGLATSAKAVASHGHGHGHLTSRSVSAGHANKAKTVHLTIHGLKAGTKYAIHVIATNSAGATHSKTIRLTTP